MLDPNIATWIRQNAAAAVETARTKGTNLNFTLPTLVSVATEIGEAQQWYAHAAAAGDASRNDVANRVSAQIAAYVGEVLVKDFGTEWCSQGNQVWIQAGSQQFFLFQTMLEDLTTGQIRLFVITSQITGKSFVQLMAEYKPGQKPAVNYDAEALAREMQETAAIAVREVKGLDFTPASLPVLQTALTKLQGMIAASPGHKSAIMNASLKKFGAYLGEVIVKYHGASWVKGAEGFAPDMPVICMTPVFVGPQLLVHAVLEQQTLLMGGKYRAATAMDFLSITQRLFMEWLAELMGGDEQTVRAAISEDSEVSQQVYSYCLIALTTATDKWKTNLDFSPDSLLRLDRILARLYELAQSGAPGSVPTEKQRTTMNMVWGAYLGETIRRKLGGTWIAGANAGEFVLRMPQDETISPVEDINGRITNGTDILTRYHSGLTAVAASAVATAVAPPQTISAPPPNPPEEVAAAQSQPAAETVPPPPAEDSAEAEARMVQQEAIAHKAFAASEDAIAEIKRIPGMGGYTLDYSVFSLQLIDKAITTLRWKLQQERTRLQQSAEDFENAVRPLAVKLGCYFCEAVRRVNGGEWREHNDSYGLQNGPVLVDGTTAVATLLSGKPAQFGTAQSAPSVSQYYLLVRPVVGENFRQLLCGAEENEPALQGVLLPQSKANKLLFGSLRSVLVHAYCNEGVLLEFDRNGLQKAEQMLQKYSTALKGPKEESDQINSYEMTCWFGTFLGEVIRRQLGARWTIESVPNQGQAIGMQLGEAKFWPLRKVQKRLEKGWEENIVFYYSAIAKMAHEGPSSLTAANSTQLQ